MNLKEKLEKLIGGHPNHLNISFNDHWVYYESAQDWVDEENRNWVSDEDREKAIRENSIWSVQYYPNTPVGFVAVCGSDLEVVIDALIEYVEKERKK